MSEEKKSKVNGSKTKFTVLIMLVFVAGLLFFATSCGDNEHHEANQKIIKEFQMEKKQLEKNKEICLGVSKAIMNGEWEKVDGLLADDFTYVGDGNKPINKEQYIGFMKNVLCGAMTDMDMKFLRVIAEGDLVAVDYTNAMTHTGVFFGVQATNKRVMATGQFIREVKNGKVTAEWQTTNAIGLMGQIGALKK